jgi:acyl-CoA synthetase (AMP-forming)/AMP-acid ligase II
MTPRVPDAPCIGTPSGWLSYGEVDARVMLMAGDLHARGVRRGDHVIVALPNLPAGIIAGLAVQALGACEVALSPDWGADALARIAAQTAARIAVVRGSDAARWSQGAAAFEHCYRVRPAAPSGLPQPQGPGTFSWISEDGSVQDPRGEPLQGETPDPESPALVLYTSGSTGVPRGVVQSHRNIAANTRSICAYLELCAFDRVMVVLPLYHCYGRSLLQTHLHVGGSVLLDSRFLYPRVVLDAMAQQRCTGFAGVPATFELLRRYCAAPSLRTPALRYLTQAGGAMRPGTVRWVSAAFAPAKLFVMYGQTEATSRLSYLPPAMAALKEGSIGCGLPGVELRVVSEDGTPTADGAIGEIIARGDNVTRGYLGDAQATAEIIRDGWLWTGDLAYRDRDGYLFITGRARELLKVRGYRFSPQEIERCLCEHPDILEAAVFGIPDAIEGQCATAYVVVRPGAAPAEEALRKFCHQRLPAYKVPKHVCVMPALPRTGAGKVSTPALRLHARPS